MDINLKKTKIFSENIGIAVSVITPAYNSKHRLERLLHCMEKQSFPRQLFEWIIVDDGSPDGPPDFFDSYQGKLQISPLRLSQNQGRAIARNTGIKQARGRIVAFLDADMEIPPYWLDTIYRAVISTGGVVVGRLKAHPGCKMNTFQSYFHSRGAAKLVSGSQVPGKYFTAANSALEKKWLEKVNGYDETFVNWGGEDLDLALRLEERGLPFYFEGNAIAFHYHDVSWKETEKRYTVYGRDVVPLLLERHSEALNLLSLDRIKEVGCLGEPDRLLRNLAVRFLLKKSLYNFIRYFVLRYPNFPWPDTFFDFMIFYLYSRTVEEEWRNNRASRKRHN